MTRALPWTLLLLVLAGFVRPVSSYDLGLHLRLGEEIARTGRIPRVDRHSYTADGRAFLDHEWLSQLLLYGVHRAAGFAGLSLAAGIFAAAAFATLYRAMRGDALPRLAALLWAAPFASAHFGTRPHVLGWLFLALLLLLCTRGRGAWGIPALLVLWANCHGSAALGAAWAVLHFSERRQWGLSAASIAAPLLNPYGISVYAHAFEIRRAAAFLDEWKPYGPGQAAFWLWVAGVSTLAFRARAMTRWNLARLAGMAVLGFCARRHAAVAALALAPMAAAAWAPAAARLGRALPGLLLAAAAWLGVQAKAAQAGSVRLDHEALPVESVGFLLRHRLEGPVFNDYNFGGWMLWAAWPQYKVFIDGRTDLYMGGPLEESRRATGAAPGWEGILSRHGVRSVLIRKDRPLARALAAHPGWSLAYYDYHAALFVAEGSSPGLKRLKNAAPWGPRDPSRTDELIGELEYLVSENNLAFDTHLNLAGLYLRKGDPHAARRHSDRYLELHPEGKALLDRLEAATPP